MRAIALVSSLAGLLALGCPTESADQAAEDTETGVGVVTLTSAGPGSSATQGATSTAGGDDSTAGDMPTGDASTAEDSGAEAGSESGPGSGSGTGDDGPPPPPENPTDCGGTIYACGDTLDNDGDGFFDLFDPECTGPCDDDESSFATGLPGDNMDCKQDCFFDGNSGQGDDGCIWSLTCDPANPGANIGCEYSGGNNCNNQPPNQTEGCIEFCTQFVPPGCDCFGCCTVTLDDGSTVDIFLNSDPECALDNLDACLSCTSQIDDCGNPCDPELCEVCFGEQDPPAGCDDPTCDNDLPCAVNEDCPSGFFCLQSCCFPPPPG
jgi:hypothetical protein